MRVKLKRKIVYFFNGIRDFLIKTLTIYTLYIGLKIFYQVDVGLEWVLFILLVGISQTITEKWAIKKEMKRVFRRFKNSEILHIGDEFVFPLKNFDEEPPQQTLLKVVDKDCDGVFVKNLKTKETIKIKNQVLDSKIMDVFVLDS